VVILIVFLMLVSGFLAANYFLKDPDNGLESAGAILFFSLAVVPFININCAFFCNKYITDNLTLVTSFAAVIFFSLLVHRANRGIRGNCFQFSISRRGSLMLALVILTGSFFYHYYTNEEFMLSLGSYLVKGDAACFYMQTFQTLEEFIPNVNGISSVNDAYGIISTPGNILFTATALSIFKLYSFKLLYILFMLLIFIFVYLIVDRIIKDKAVSLLAALFAVFNPYLLSVEVLDRNVMALAISVVLFYLILKYPGKVFLQGLIFGILSGTGLRFLPLLFVLPIVILHFHRRINLMGSLVFIAGFIITFTFNVPHLYFHGFHGLGETSSSASLIINAFTKWVRTPFLPFPNLISYLLNILNYFGWLVSVIILAGVLRLWNNNRRLTSAFLVMFLSVIFVLSFQRNWLEGDKYRIAICGFLPLFIFFACGLKYIFTKKYSLKKITLLFACFLLPFIFVRLISLSSFNLDEEFSKRKFIYQSEAAVYHQLARKSLLDIGILPNYKRLADKLDLKRKAREDEIVFGRLFPGNGLPGFDKYRDFYKQWGGYFLKDSIKYPEYNNSDYSYLKIDFGRLASNLPGSAEKINYFDMPAIDFMAEDSLFDVYYTDLKVDWQAEKLPVSVIIHKEEIKYLRELNIDLNAFISFGKDNDGFDKIYPVSFKADPLLKVYRNNAGMGSFPLVSEGNTVVLHVPDDLKIVIRNWFINEKGASYKLDSWCIKQDDKGNYKVEFFYNEPESYL